MRQVTAYEAIAIFGDYDGMAPDTQDLAIVATQEVADQVCALLNGLDHADGEDTVTLDGTEFVLGNLPCVDGHQSNLRFKTGKTLIANEFEALDTAKEVLEKAFDATPAETEG